MAGGKDFKRQNSIIFSIVGVLGIGSLTMFGMGISGQKYARVEFCFKPDKGILKSKKSVTKFCNEDKRHVVPEVSWNAAQFEPANPYYQSETAFIIPNKASRLKTIPPTNPNYGWYLVGALGCSVLAAGTCQQRINIYKSDFIGYLAKTKKVLKENVLTTESDLKVYEHTVAEKEITAKDSITRQYQSFRDEEKSEGEKYTEQLNSQLNNELAMQQHQLSLAQLGKETAENVRDKAKAEKETQKVLGMKNSDLEPESATSTKLELDEQYRWIYQLLKLPFRVLSGEQGSGKSTLERLMIRLLKDDGYHVVIINSETNPSVWGGVQVLTNAEEMNIFFESFPATIQERKQQAIDQGIDEDDYLDYLKGKSGLEGKVAIFLMESNTYEVHGVDPDHWANFLKQSLTNIRKWGFTVCLTAHSDNQTAVSSKLSGFSKLIDTAPRVECISTTNKDGEAVSSGKAWLKMKGVNDKEPVEVSLYNYPKSKKF
jgi:hypothetical protein